MKVYLTLTTGFAGSGDRINLKIEQVWNRKRQG